MLANIDHYVDVKNNKYNDFWLWWRNQKSVLCRHELSKANYILYNSIPDHYVEALFPLFRGSLSTMPTNVLAKLLGRRIYGIQKIDPLIMAEQAVVNRQGESLIVVADIIAGL
jgi:hypothetical protein